MGENWPVISTESCDFHAYTFGFFHIPSEGRLVDFFFALKNLTDSAGFEPANLGTKSQHGTSRPPKLLSVDINQRGAALTLCFLLLPRH